MSSNENQKNKTHGLKELQGLLVSLYNPDDDWYSSVLALQMIREEYVASFPNQSQSIVK